MTRQFLNKWFEEQLLCALPDGNQAETVLIGRTEFTPIEILRVFEPIYEQEFAAWLSYDWKLPQSTIRDEILSSYPANAGRYHDLKEAVMREQVLPFVGSGMSVPSGLPTWTNFLLQIAGLAVGDISKVERFIDASDFEGAMDLLYNNMNWRLFSERVEHDLRITDPIAIDGPVCLLPGLFSSLVVTTNLDNVLEAVYRICDLPFGHTLSGTSLARYRSLKDPKERFLLKLHGDHENQQGRVLLSSEYDEAYSSDSPTREELVFIYRQYSLLFLGCSLGPDRTVDLVRGVASKDENIPKHYAFLERPSDEENLRRREHDLTDAGIYPIWYDLPHDQAIMALLDGLLVEGGTV